MYKSRQNLYQNWNIRAYAWRNNSEPSDSPPAGDVLLISEAGLKVLSENNILLASE